MNPMELINSAGNKIFGLKFVKADGTIRTMAARRHVSRPKNCQAPQGLQDRESDDARLGTLTVYDFNADRKNNTLKGGYRRFAFNRLLEIKLDGKVYKVGKDGQCRL